MLQRRTHTKIISSHPIVEYHTYTWEHYLSIQQQHDAILILGDRCNEDYFASVGVKTIQEHKFITFIVVFAFFVQKYDNI